MPEKPGASHLPSVPLEMEISGLLQVSRHFCLELVLVGIFATIESAAFSVVGHMMFAIRSRGDDSRTERNRKIEIAQSVSEI